MHCSVRDEKVGIEIKQPEKEFTALAIYGFWV